MSFCFTILQVIDKAVSGSGLVMRCFTKVKLPGPMKAGSKSSIFHPGFSLTCFRKGLSVYAKEL